MIIQRDLLKNIKVFLKRKEYIALIGPRQAGKTTFLEIVKNYLLRDLHVNEDLIHTVTFEDRRLLAEFDADPVSFVRSYLTADSGKTSYLMIDEFQYAQDGGQRLKLIYDTIKGVKIIITGSSSLDIKAQVGRYLVGRILTFHLYPFNFGEYLRAKDSRLERIYLERNGPIVECLFEGRPMELKNGKDPFYEEMIRH
ncbi:MAG: AAA family ATPase [Thermodesulfobacteriota bacterium]